MRFLHTLSGILGVGATVVGAIGDSLGTPGRVAVAVTGGLLCLVTNLTKVLGG